jgi:Tfp pilus assembly protein PilO
MTGAELVPLLKKHPIGLVCGVLSISCAALLYFRGDMIEEYQQLNDQKSAEMETTIANVRNSEKLVEQTAEIQAAAKELEGRLMKAGQLAANLQYFYRLEADTGVKLQDVRQGGLKPGNKAATTYIGVPYTVSVQGTFPQVLNFMGRLQKGVHFCRFNNIAMTKAGDDAVTLNMDLDILGIP